MCPIYYCLLLMQLLSKAEDEDDVVAAKAARDEQVAERAEFDECFVPRVSTSEQVSNL